MGTRNLFTIVHDGKLKLAKYNQWDGYLDGQGKALSDFIVDELDFERLINELNKVQLITENEYDEKMKSIGITTDMITFEQGDKITETFPLLSRDCGIGGALNAIQNKTYTIEKSDFSGEKMVITSKTLNIPDNHLVSIDAHDFKDDGLFCKYWYELNLDTQQISVYEGGKNLLFKCHVLEFPDKLDKQIALQK